MRNKLSMMVALFAIGVALSGCTADSSCGMPTGGAGTASIVFTKVPAKGSTGDVEGTVQHVIPTNNFVAVYLHVPGLGFWTKPTFADPETPIRCNGSFSSAIVTGGEDLYGDQIVAFVLPSGYQVPLLSGSSTLPASLYSGSLAHVSAAR